MGGGASCDCSCFSGTSGKRGGGSGRLAVACGILSPLNCWYDAGRGPCAGCGRELRPWKEVLQDRCQQVVRPVAWLYLLVLLFLFL